jgi:hypothetical protein
MVARKGMKDMIAALDINWEKKENEVDQKGQFQLF